MKREGVPECRCLTVERCREMFVVIMNLIFTTAERLLNTQVSYLNRQISGEIFRPICILSVHRCLTNLT